MCQVLSRIQVWISKDLLFKRQMNINENIINFWTAKVMYFYAHLIKKSCKHVINNFRLNRTWFCLIINCINPEFFLNQRSFYQIIFPERSVELNFFISSVLEMKGNLKKTKIKIVSQKNLIQTKKLLFSWNCSKVKPKPVWRVVNDSSIVWFKSCRVLKSLLFFP